MKRNLVKYMGLRVSPALHAKIEQEALTEDINTSDVVRRILNRHYNLNCVCQDS